MNNKILIAVVAAVVVIGGVVAVAIVLNNGGGSKSDDTQHPIDDYAAYKALVFGNANGDTVIDSKDVDLPASEPRARGP